MQQLNEIPDLQNFIKEVKTGPTQRFRNNGPWTQKEDYEFKTTVDERCSFTFSRAFNQISSIGFEKGVEITGKTNQFMLSALENVQTGVPFKYAVSFIGTETKSYEYRESSDFKIAKQIIVPPCTEYNITSYVSIAENVVFNYRVEFKLTGVLEPGIQMSSTEIRAFVKDVKIVKDLDDFTVIAEATAMLKATFGYETVIDASGLVSDECINLEKQCTCNNNFESKN